MSPLNRVSPSISDLTFVNESVVIDVQSLRNTAGASRHDFPTAELISRNSSYAASLCCGRA